MDNSRKRYRQMEQYMTYALLADLVLFILFLITAGNGIIWLKVILAILTIALSGLCLAYLYLTQELLRQRSFWMSVGAAAILVCLLFSLILNYPSPHKYKNNDASQTSSAVQE